MNKKDIKKEDLIEQINSGKSKAEIYAYFSARPETVNRYAKMYGIDLRSVKRKKYTRIRNYPNIDKEWLIKNWVDTDKSLNTLSLENSIPLGVLEYRASFYGLTKKYKYKVNTEKITDMQNPDVYYLAGLISTDGYLERSHDAVSIRLNGESERVLLENIRKCFSIESPIRKYRDSYDIRISFDGFQKFLSDNFYIPRENKTFELGIPKTFYNEECAKMFVLGCLDGDGCISHKAKRVRVCTASEEFVFGLGNIIKKYCDVSVHFGCHKGLHGDYPEIYICGSNATKFLQWVYSNNSSLRLERKYNLYVGK